MGMAAFMGQSIPQSILGLQRWERQPGGRPDLPTRSLSKNQLCPSYFPQHELGEAGVADSSSGLGCLQVLP